MLKHNKILQNAVDSNNGFVFKTAGDAFCCAFHTADDAVNAAIDIQRKLNAEEWNGIFIKVRTGIHSGRSEWSGSDYMGYMTLARTARVMSSAYGEQIIISNDTFKSLSIKADSDSGKKISFRDLGERRLKDVIQPIKLYQIISPGLREDFPPLKTLDARPNNLPVQISSFIGREKVLKEVKDLLYGSRLLTLIGTGGGGKTRLAMQTGADMIDEFVNGVFIAELAPVTNPELIAPAILNSLGLKEEQNKTPEETVTDFLKGKELLLILDNCEHLVHECAVLSNNLLSNCEKLKLIVTSREALNCTGEQIYRLPSMSLPELTAEITPEKLVKYESVRLFIERALSVSPDFRVNEKNAHALAKICSRLDGIPLAIELAAARVKILTIEKIFERLNDRFSLLTGGNRTSLPRQQTLKALIDWSYDLLSDNEKILWSRLSVFSGGWTLEAAEEICSDDIISKDEILDLLSQLTEKSIIMYDEENERYRILETIKQYGESKLSDKTEMKRIVSGYLDYFFNKAKSLSLGGADAEYRILKIEADHNNLMSAIESNLSDGDIEKCAALANRLEIFWEIRGYYSAGLRLIELILNNRGGLSENTEARLYSTASTLNRQLGNNDKSREYSLKSLELFRKDNDKSELINSIIGLANTEASTGNFDKAEKLYNESLALSREIDYVSGIAFSLNNLGNISLVRGNLDKAEKIILESLEFHKRSGNKRNICFALDSLGNIYMDKENPEKAKYYLNESLEIAREIGDKSGIAFALHNLAAIMFSGGNFDEGLKYNEESLKLRTEIGEKTGIAYSLDNIGRAYLIQKNFSEAQKYFNESLKLRIKSGDMHAILLLFKPYIRIFINSGQNISAVKLLGAVESGIKTLGIAVKSEELTEYEVIKNEIKDNFNTEEFLQYFEEGKRMSIIQAGELILKEK
ncbi:MAG TPA: hypothetical protein DCY06_11575 [Bacteroidetes bacterium]|nr:hypothetical protein [Bacteroidota bacterium]